MLKWRTPLEGMTSDCLTVTRNGEKIQYDGIYMKRSLPGPDEFLLMAAGQTVSSTFDVSMGYDMTKAGTYSIAVDTYLEYAVGSVKGLNVPGKPGIQTKIAHLSSPAEVFQVIANDLTKRTLGQRARSLEDRKRFSDKSFSRRMLGPKRPLSEQNDAAANAPLDAIVKLCTASQRRATKEVHRAAYHSIKSAIPNLENNPDRVKTWFGKTPVKDATKIFEKMEEILRSDKITYVFGGKYCEKDMFAYTFPGTRKIYLCKSYQKSPKLSGFDNKMGILTHELSHALGHTDDKVYGQSACKQIAKKAPRRALKNADNYEYFVETLG